MSLSHVVELLLPLLVGVLVPVILTVLRRAFPRFFRGQLDSHIEGRMIASDPVTAPLPSTAPLPQYPDEVDRPGIPAPNDGRRTFGDEYQ